MARWQGSASSPKFADVVGVSVLECLLRETWRMKTWLFASLLCLNFSCATGGADTSNSEQGDVADATVALAPARECVIRVGGGGETRTYPHHLRPGEVWQWRRVTASDFIRETSGPCEF